MNQDRLLDFDVLAEFQSRYPHTDSAESDL